MAIPKIIHYCWLSGDPYPAEIKRCIESWHDTMPEYEFRLWDQKNFACDVVPYVRQAVERRKWAFASDYIRLWALYNEGGIYLDSDICVSKSFDPLLSEQAFTGIEKGGRVAAWIFGSEAGNPVIGELLHYYDGRDFLDPDGIPDQTPNTIPVTRTLIDHGLAGEDRTQRLDWITVFSSDYFCPLDPWSGKMRRTENTYAMHLFKGAWMDSDDEIRFMRSYEAYTEAFIGDVFPNGIGRLIIYGAGILGHLVFGYLREYHPGGAVEAFLVSKKEYAWNTIENIQVRELEESDDLERIIPVLIATVPKHHDVIRGQLLQKGFMKVFCLGE